MNRLPRILTVAIYMQLGLAFGYILGIALEAWLDMPILFYTVACSTVWATVFGIGITATPKIIAP